MVEHDYFGVVGDYWAETIEYADQIVEVVLDASGDESPAALDAAATLVGELEYADDDLRAALVEQLGSKRSPVMQFLDAVLDSASPMSRAVAAAIGIETGDRQIDALRSLALVRVDLHPDADDVGGHFAEFEYALAADELDERLIATIDIERALTDLRFVA